MATHLIKICISSWPIRNYEVVLAGLGFSVESCGINCSLTTVCKVVVPLG